MATPAEVIKQMTGFDSIDAFDYAMKVPSIEKAIVDINRDQLRNHGILSTGEKITPKYTPNYQKYYKKGNKTGSTPDQYLSGDQSRKMQFVKHGHGEVTIDSPMPYTEYNKKRYTGDIFGVIQDNMGQVKSTTLPTINKRIKELLGL